MKLMLRQHLIGLGSLPALCFVSQSAWADLTVMSGETVQQVGFGLLMVLVLIAAVAQLAKRFLNSTHASAQTMRIVAGLSIGQREKLVLVEVGGAPLLLGVTQHQITQLTIDHDYRVKTDKVEAGIVEQVGSEQASGADAKDRKNPGGLTMVLNQVLGRGRS